MRRQPETTFQEMRRHLGFETHRLWRRIRRYSGPHRRSFLGLSSPITVFAHGLMVQAAGGFRRAAWCHKSYPTFADALALVRKELWAREDSRDSSWEKTDTMTVPRAFMERLTDVLCYAA